MDHGGCARALALLVALLAAEGLARPEPRPQAPAPGAGKAPAGTAYDEIVVETHLAVRPKSPSVGVGLRRAKAVYFRPNATASASGAQVRRVTPLAPAAAATASTTSSPSTSGDGISFAARVVGVENPLVTRARLAAAAQRSRRESLGTPGSHSSSSSYSFSSSSTSSRSSTWTLPGGQTLAVHEDSFSSQENGGKPSSSSVLRIVIGEH